MIEYMTVKEVAARWRVSKMTVYRLVQDRTLPAVQIGRSLRIDKQDVLDMERHHVHPPQ